MVPPVSTTYDLRTRTALSGIKGYLLAVLAIVVAVIVVLVPWVTAEQLLGVTIGRVWLFLAFFGVAGGVFRWLCRHRLSRRPNEVDPTPIQNPMLTNAGKQEPTEHVRDLMTQDVMVETPIGRLNHGLAEQLGHYPKEVLPPSLTDGGTAGEKPAAVSPRVMRRWGTPAPGPRWG
jgi:hypothetical protein